MASQSSIEDRLIALLLDKNLTLSVAESCTGGLLGHRLTNVSGSSGAFIGGVIAYANQAKENVLKVKSRSLINHGAVSAQVAKEMAIGVQNLLGTDYALSVTGVAGPGGGSDDKPVGLVFIGLASKDKVISKKYLWNGDRDANKKASAEAAMTLLGSVILKRGDAQ